MPGPGSYQTPVARKTAPAFRFGRAKRPELAKSITPGPGSYKIKVKIANVPDYALPSRKPEHLFV